MKVESLVLGVVVGMAGMCAAADGAAKWIGEHGETELTWRKEDCNRCRGITDYKGHDFIISNRLPKTTFRLRRDFDLPAGKIVEAKADACGFGFYELWVNGAKADPTRMLAPGKEAKARIDDYDLAAQLRPGRVNTVGLWLSPGYSDDFSRYGDPWLAPKRGYFDMTVRYDDGRKVRVVSDGSWLSTKETPIPYVSIYHGETYDAAQEDPFWATDRAKGEWKPVVVFPDGPVQVRSTTPPIRMYDPRRPVSVTETDPGVYTLDFGQNRAGLVTIRAKGPKGTKITLHTSELLDDAGKRIDPWSNRKAKSTDTFILAGTGAVEEYTPRFTYHGFRYAEVRGYPGTPTADDFTGWAVNADVKDVSSFRCSDSLLNWLHDAAYWTMRSNLMSIPTDTPSRDERVGCAMDSQTYEDAACQFFDMRGYYADWLRRSGAPTSGNPDWNGDAMTLPLRLWKYYGDKAQLEKSYPVIKGYVDAQMKEHPDFIFAKGYGDWCAPNDRGDKSWKSYFNDVEVVNTSIFCQILDGLVTAAEALGKTDDAAAYRRHLSAAKASFHARFYKPETGAYGAGSQTTAAMPLAFGIVPADCRRAVVDHLVRRIRGEDRRHFWTGIFGTRYLPDVLCDVGECDLLMEMIHQPGFPGYEHMRGCGATTLWEQWYLKDGMNSKNHAMWAGGASWLYSHLAGIRPAKPGYAEVLVKPVFPKALSFVEAKRMTPHGEVAVRWERQADGIAVSVTVPDGVPAVFESSEGVRRALKAGKNDFVLPPRVKLADEIDDGRPTVRWRGFNLLEMFIMGRDRTPKEFREEDFQMIHDWGFNFVRLPMDYRYWIKGGEWKNWEEFDEDHLRYIDRAIALGRKYGIHVSINMHRCPGYTVANPKEPRDLFKDPEAQRVCAKHWAMFARRYRGIPNSELSFNLFNEPPNVEDSVYGPVAKKLIEAIRAEDPARFVIADGIGFGRQPIPSLFGMKGVGQATRGYAPMSVSHYMASWVGTPSASPQWPIAVTAPSGTLGGKAKAKEGMYVPFVVRDLPPCKAIFSYGMISGPVTLEFAADGKVVQTLKVAPALNDPLWTNAKQYPKWGNIIQGAYRGTNEVDLPGGAKEFSVRVASGDWATIGSMKVVSPDGKERVLSFETDWGAPKNFEQRFLGFERGFRSADKTVAALRYVDDGQNYLDQKALRPWEDMIRDGNFCFCGEFAVFSKTPHAIALALIEDYLTLWKERNMGWAMWNLRGGMGVLDSRRDDVEYEDFRGHKLDRKMLDLLQKY